MSKLATVFGAIAVAMTVYASGGKAAAASTCPNVDRSIGRTIHDILVQNPAITFEKFVGLDAQTGIAIYNTLPEPGHDTGDTFYLAFDLRNHTAYMAITRGDCLISNGAWTERAGFVVRKAIEQARGLPL